MPPGLARNGQQQQSDQRRDTDNKRQAIPNFRPSLPPPIALPLQAFGFCKFAFKSPKPAAQIGRMVAQDLGELVEHGTLHATAVEPALKAVAANRSSARRSRGLLLPSIAHKIGAPALTPGRSPEWHQLPTP